MFDKKEYKQKWQKENKDKVKAYNDKYRELHKEKVKETQRNYRKNNPEKVKEIDARSHTNFIKNHDWNKYCCERRKARAERLREQGIKNPWSVINGKEAKYREEKDEYTMQ